MVTCLGILHRTPKLLAVEISGESRGEGGGGQRVVSARSSIASRGANVGPGLGKPRRSRLTVQAATDLPALAGQKAV